MREQLRALTNENIQTLKRLSHSKKRDLELHFRGKQTRAVPSKEIAWCSWITIASDNPLPSAFVH